MNRRLAPFAWSFVGLASVVGCSGRADDLFGGSGGAASTNVTSTVDGSSNGAADASTGTTTASCEPEACPPGTFCEPLSGCVPTMVCATTEQCLDALGDDPCKVDVACDPARALCVYATLDTDGDHHPPIACGGGDCNDADPSVFPGATEVCDGVDDDCDQAPDDGAICGPRETCQEGACACAPENRCDAACPDKTSDPLHCGACGTVCPAGGLCQNGDCVCPGSLTECGGACVDTLADPSNCNTCGNVCAGGCSAGTCVCTVDLLLVADVSASMTGARWSALRGGIAGYLASPVASGSSVGLLLSPVDSGSCNLADYQVPVVPIGPLPGGADAVNQTLASFDSLFGASTPPVALQGALAHAKSVAGQAGRNMAVVLFADDLPNICTANFDQPTDLVAIAQPFATGTPRVETYVVAIGDDDPVASWNAVAAAGGTGTAVVAHTSAEVEAALVAIRAQVASCN